jgi:hypothetical protein
MSVAWYRSGKGAIRDSPPQALHLNSILHQNYKLCT